MSQSSKPFRRRQILTTSAMIAFILICVAASFYFRAHPLTEKAKEVANLEIKQENVQSDVEDAMSRLASQTDEKLADVRAAAVVSDARKAELVFEGVADADTTRSIVEMLTERGISATFYFTSAEAASQPESLQIVNQAGLPIGAVCDPSITSWSSMTQREIVESLCNATSEMQLAIGLRPSSLLFKQGAPSEPFVQAATACYINEIVMPTSYVNAQSFSTGDEARAYIGNLDRSAILCVRLALARPQLVSVVGWVMDALGESDLAVRASALIETNDKKLAQPLTRVYTTEKGVAYTFSDLGNDMELVNLLHALDTLSAKCTFFVTADEIANKPDLIQMLLDQGHDLGIAVNASQMTAKEALEAILLAQEQLSLSFGVKDVSLVRPAFGAVSDELREAASAGGFTLVTQTYSIVRSGDARATDAQVVYDSVFGTDTTQLQRGAILHFQMDQYTQSDSLLGQVAVLIHNRRNPYKLLSANAMFDDLNLAYRYPLAENEILPQVYNRIHPGQLTGSVIQAIQQSYIGTEWVSGAKMLPGFTAAEIKTLDKTGLIKNNQNMVFLTFDDWGTDASINAILEVLARHNAKATFFVRTENVHYNPNLLRAIAMEGHAIASHTHTHFALANTANAAGTSFTSLTADQVLQLKEDLVTSYDVLQSIVGDIMVDGRPALTTLFRPPTLAVSREGLEAVLDCGFSYSVSGYYSTQDYKASSAERLASSLSANTKSGSIIVMHMSDTSVYTPDALELYLTKMELRAPKNQFKFVRLDEALPAR